MKQLGITYQMALALKNAGFPQKIERIIAAQEVSSHNVPKYDHRVFDLSLMGYPKEEPDYYTQGKWRSAHYFSREYIDSEECDVLYFPKLDELIEACGDGLQMLSRVKLEGVPLWAATDTKIHRWASDPEEAVANLYLELNKK